MSDDFARKFSEALRKTFGSPEAVAERERLEREYVEILAGMGLTKRDILEQQVKEMLKP